MICEAEKLKKQVKTVFDRFLKNSINDLSGKNVLKVDLHCHDYNSNKATETLGRILMAAETWLPSGELIKALKRHNVDGITVTNHNNAKTCYDLQKKGIDVLTAAEFTCTVPEEEVDIHVLTYGFTPSDESVLFKKRRNLYDFMEYVKKKNLVTILAHPLYFSSKNKSISPDFMEKLALIFERFETVNGQRSTYQNVLVWEWLETLTPQKIETLSRKHNIPADKYCVNPYEKKAYGGSDDHMGIYAGGTGTYIEVPPHIPSNAPVSTKILEGLRTGKTAPYGSYTDYRRLEIALTDYFCQLLLHLDDPGLTRIILHQGSIKDKWLSFAIINTINELRRHQYTSSFLKMLHEAFRGKGVNLIKKMAVSKKLQPVIREIDKISHSFRFKEHDFDNYLNHQMDQINNFFSGYLISQTRELFEENTVIKEDLKLNWQQIISSFDVPSIIRSWSPGKNHDHSRKKRAHDPTTKEAQNFHHPRLSDVLDNLRFPFIASFLMQALSFASLQAMYSGRGYQKQFAEKENLLHGKSRALWLTDTFRDKNGIAKSIDEYLKVICEKDLPVDILICGEDFAEEPHVKVLKPETEFTLPFYKEQTIRVPNLLEIQKLIINGGYDRVICSTELFMGLVAVYLKYAFHIPVYFFMHTDWLEFAKHTLKLQKEIRSRMKRLLRSFYGTFDGIFVLNEDHKKWLSGKKMRIDENKIFKVHHWVDETVFIPSKSFNTQKRSAKTPTILFTGRLSEEKGVMMIVDVYKKLRNEFGACNVIIAGKGPKESELKSKLKNADFKGWVEQKDLPELYGASDLMILPNKFDTFGRVILEAMSCGCPVASFNQKGPKEIIKNSSCGILSGSKKELLKDISEFFKDPERINQTKVNALKRAAEFSKHKTINIFMEKTGLNYQN